MPFNGSGVFNPAITFVPNTSATAEDQNTQDTDFASGLSNCITRDGQSTVTANISMGGFQVKNVAAGTAGSDVATVSQISNIAPTGMILMFGGSVAPAGYVVCDGAALSRTTYASLYAVIGTSYGSGDGVSTFNIPDLRGRSPLGSGAGSGLTPRTLGTSGGEENHLLTSGEMPSHTHTDSGHSHVLVDPGHAHNPPIAGQFAITGSGSSVGLPAGVGVNPQSVTGTSTTGITINNGAANIQSTGGGGTHNNMHPWCAVNYIIKT